MITMIIELMHPSNAQLNITPTTWKIISSIFTPTPKQQIKIISPIILNMVITVYYYYYIIYNSK